AVLATIFILLSYLAMNALVAIEASTGMIAYRPLLRVPAWITYSGLSLCIIALFAINPVIALVGITLLVGLFAWLSRQEIPTEEGAWRSGIAAAMAHRVAGRTQHSEAA